VMTEDDEDFANQDDFKDLEDILNHKLEENLDMTSKLSKLLTKCATLIP
jgi:hypothetical protein